jgi:hypothetical protein
MSTHVRRLALVWVVPTLVWTGAAVLACSSGSLEPPADFVEPASSGPGPAGNDTGGSVSGHDPGASTNDSGVVYHDAVHDGGAAHDSGAVACIPARTPSGDTHSPDYDCMASGCHGPGVAVAGLLITVSGTLYGSATGGATVGGATVVVTDKDGKTIEMVTSTTGIFWSGYADGTHTLPQGPQGTCTGGSCSTYAAAGPMQAVSVSKCPDVPMGCPTPNDGECATCHNPATPGQSAVHLP